MCFVDPLSVNLNVLQIQWPVFEVLKCELPLQKLVKSTVQCILNEVFDGIEVWYLIDDCPEYTFQHVIIYINSFYQLGNQNYLPSLLENHIVLFTQPNHKACPSDIKCMLTMTIWDVWKLTHEILYHWGCSTQHQIRYFSNFNNNTIQPWVNKHQL
jgi:hypothetical protein